MIAMAQPGAAPHPYPPASMLLQGGPGTAGWHIPPPSYGVAGYAGGGYVPPPSQLNGTYMY